MNRLQRSHIGNKNNVINRAKSVLRGLSRQADSGTVDILTANRELSELIVNLERLDGSTDVSSRELKTSIRLLRVAQSRLPTENSTSTDENAPAKRLEVNEPIPSRTQRGRPKFSVDVHRLQQLLGLGFSIQKIAKDGLMGEVVHPSTLHRRLKEENISVRAKYTDIDEENLRSHITEYNFQHPNAGSEDVWAYLKSVNIYIPRERCRMLLREIDGIGTATRWSTTINRRKYSVPYANFLWHLDTHHSLKRWGIVVHGGIDGYSRLIPFLRAATSNSAKAAATFFVAGTNNFGIPSRVRTDHGTEYVHIGQIMEHVNGENRGSFLVGPSVHNQRIERLWRDVFVKVIDPFYKLFSYMEDKKLLDVSNEVHMFVLQYVFVRRIDSACKRWKESHNHHKLRTEGNQSPHMLWFQSLLAEDTSTGSRNISHPPIDRMAAVLEQLGISENDKEFLIPRYSCPLPDNLMVELKSTIDVKRESQSRGLDVFGDVLAFVRRNSEI